MSSIQNLVGKELALGLVSLVVLLLFAASRLIRKRSPYPLPPGPRGEPILGHVRVVPSIRPELYYEKLAKDYDTDILYFEQLGTPVIILNTVKAAEELLSKRGANYSDRPRFVLFEVMGWGLTLTFLPWGPRWKAHRALIQKAFTKSNIIQYQELQEQEAQQAVYSIVHKPAEWEQFLRRFASAIVLRIGFGVTLSRDDDPYIQLATDANEVTAGGGSPGSSIVDYFPFLRYFPNWIVRSDGLRHAREWGWAIQKLHDVPFAAARKDFESGNGQTSSYVYPLLQRHAENEQKGLSNDFSIADINGSAAAIFVAGSGTTFTTILVGILNLMQNPEVFMKARSELDRAIGIGRLPSLKDRENPQLQYIEYLVEEVVRWRPLSPVGIPHKSVKDDIYNDMFIPKGSLIYFNAWAMSRNEAVYREPELFNPDRFRSVSEGGGGEPFLQAPFGFGRRICVGRDLAKASVWIVLATLIATIDICKPVRPDGKALEQIVEFSTGLSSHPNHFDCDFKPRSKQAEMLLSGSLN